MVIFDHVQEDLIIYSLWILTVSTENKFYELKHLLNNLKRFYTYTFHRNSTITFLLNDETFIIWLISKFDKKKDYTNFSTKSTFTSSYIT